MKLSKDGLNDEVVLRLKDSEFSIVIASLRAAASDDTRRGIDYVNFYSAERGDVVKLQNQIANGS